MVYIVYERVVASLNHDGSSSVSYDDDLSSTNALNEDFVLGLNHQGPCFLLATVLLVNELNFFDRAEIF